MRSWKLAAASLLALTGAAWGSVASAQESLVDLIQAGNREAVLAAITGPHVDVNVAEPDGTTALHYAVYKVDPELVRALLDAGANADVTSLYGSTPLTEAVKLGHVEMVQMLLDAGANPNSPNLDNQTALMLAAAIGSLPIAELLVERGADVNAVETFRGQTALMWAAAENYPEIAQLLLDHGADVAVRATHDDWGRQMTSEPRAQFRPTGGLTALLYAARSGCYACAVGIVEAGGDVNQPNPDGVTPLINALDNRNFDIAMYLLDRGANESAWDMNGRTPLYVAVDMNSFRGGGFGPNQNFQGFGGDNGPTRVEQTHTALDVVDRLLAMGVDVNHELTRIRPNGPGRGRFADYMMRGGVGPLYIATLSYDTDSIARLIERGAEADLPNVFQITPLMAAAGMSGTSRGAGGARSQGDIQTSAIATIDLLLGAGANINAQVTDSHTYTAKLDTYVQGRDQEGRTALMAAAELGWIRVVEHLIEKGADPSIVDAQGLTALDIARAPAPRGPGGGGAPPANEGVDREAVIALLETKVAAAPGFTEAAASGGER